LTTSKKLLVMPIRYQVIMSAGRKIITIFHWSSCMIKLYTDIGASGAASRGDAPAQVLAQQALERRHLDERRQARRHAALVTAVRLALRLAAALLLCVGFLKL